MKRHYYLLPLLFLPLTSCAGAAPVTGIHFAKLSYSLNVGESVDLGLVVEGSGTPWYVVADEKIASVTTTGTLQALKKGSTNVFAFCGDFHARAVVTVTEVEEENYSKRAGTFNISAEAPAFSLEGSMDAVPFTLYQRDGNKGPYLLEAGFPKNALLRSSLNYADSLIRTSNPDDELPEGYEDYVNTLKNLSEGDGTLTMKTLFEDGLLTNYFYDGSDYLGSVERDFSSQFSTLSLAVNALPLLLEQGIGDVDIVNVFRAFFPDEEYTLESPKVALVRAIIGNAEVLIKNESTKTTINLHFDEKMDESIFAVLDKEVGTHQFNDATLSLVYEKLNDKFELSKISLAVSCVLFGAENRISFDVSMPKGRESMEKQQFDELIQALPQ